MSLINKLLQDLEQRQAGDTHSAAIPAGVQSVFRARRRAGWLVPAMMLLPLVAAGLLWAVMSNGSVPPASMVKVAAKPAPALVAAPPVVAAPAANVEVAEVAKVEVAKVEVAKVEVAKAEVAKMEAVKAPEPAAVVKAVATPVEPSKRVAPKLAAAKPAEPVAPVKDTVVAVANPKTVAVRQATKPDTPPEPKSTLTEANIAGMYPGIVRKPVKEPTAVAAAQPAPAAAPPEPSLTKVATLPEPKSQKTFTPRQQSDNLFKQAVLHAQQGQPKEARELLVKSLEASPQNAAARQMLVSLLVEANRLPDALSLSREGVKISPDQSGMWTSLARLQLEYGDATGATATLEEGLPSANDDAPYHAFYAAVQQRAGRHEVALKHYLVALASDPGMPNWLVGAGISMQALGRDMDAAEAFQRAKDGGQLPPAFTAFVDQRLSTLKR